MKNIIKILSLLILLSSCQKERVNYLIGDWQLVYAENHTEIDIINGVDSSYQFSYNSGDVKNIYEKTQIYIDTINVNNTRWIFGENKVNVNNKYSFNYSLITYDKYIDVETTPLRRVYEITMLDEDDLIVKTPQQYIDMNNGQGTKIIYCILKFKK